MILAGLMDKLGKTREIQEWRLNHRISNSTTVHADRVLTCKVNPTTSFISHSSSKSFPLSCCLGIHKSSLITFTTPTTHIYHKNVFPILTPSFVYWCY